MDSSFRYLKLVAFAVGGLLAGAGANRAADLSLPITGALLGTVVDAANTPQMGASVLVFDRYHRLISKTTTGINGRFNFPALSADLYSIRVSLPTFLPALRDGIAVQVGLESVLQIHLATLLSSVDVNYKTPLGAMSDDWRWVLRTSPSTRPVTRFQEAGNTSGAARFRSRIFSSTHAMLSLNGGEGGPLDTQSTAGDVGSSFAVSTNILGKNQLQLTGTYGNNSAIGSPAIALAATYSRVSGDDLLRAPEIKLSYRQLALMAEPNTSGAGSAAALRMMAVSVYQVSDIGSDIHLEYGANAESVAYLQHRSRVSPFLRATSSLGSWGDVVASYSNGGQPSALFAHDRGSSGSEGVQFAAMDPVQTSAALTQAPQLSYRGGRLEMQRTQSYEAGYRKMVGTRQYAVSTFYEDVSNGVLNVAGDWGLVNGGDLLSDGVSKTSIYNVGRYRRSGYVGSVNQPLGQHVRLSLSAGRIGGLTPRGTVAAVESGAGDRLMQTSNHNTVNVHLQARAPQTKTRVAAHYGWVDGTAIILRHNYTTQDLYTERGLNIELSQPLPAVTLMGGHFEVTAELRNLLAQGYLPIVSGDGQQLLAVQAPRAIRGGLSFIF